MTRILLRATGIWLIIAVGAVLNGLLREKVLVPMIGQGAALPLSGVMLATLVFLVTLISVSCIGVSARRTCLLVGLVWLVLTLSFEVLLGHFLAGKPWEEIARVFDIRGGDLFSLVLLVTAVSPWAAAKARGIL